MAQQKAGWNSSECSVALWRASADEFFCVWKGFLKARKGLFHRKNLHSVGLAGFSLSRAHGEQNVIAASEEAAIDQKLNGSCFEVLRCKRGEIKEKGNDTSAKGQSL